MLDAVDLDPADVIDALLGSMHHACFVMGHGRKPLLATEAFCGLAGYSREEFLALETTKPLSTDELRIHASRALNRALAGEPSRLRRREIVRRDGDLVWVDGRAALLPAPGVAPLVLSEFWPVEGPGVLVETHRSADVATASGDVPMPAPPDVLLDGLLAALHHACLLVDGRGEPLLVTEAFRELAGYDPGEFAVGARSDELLVPDEGAPAFEHELERAFDEGSPPRLTRGALRTAADDRVPVDWAVTPVDLPPRAALVECWPLSGAAETVLPAA
jgi:PAS domain S-box-containing protein